MERRIIPLQELPLKNDFMFGQVMRNPDICKLFLEELLGKEIERIEYIENQKEFGDSYDHHGIRLDVYLRDGSGTVYAIEMQTIRKYALEKRVRFYQGSIDRNELLKGHAYSELSESFIIFICDFDYFGTGLAVNERVSYIKDTDAVYEDGSHVIFLNSRYTKSNAGPAIKEYLDYIRTNDDSVGYSTELLQKTVEKVQEVRSDDKMEVSYMMWQLKYQDAVEEGRAEGRMEGRMEGRAEGRMEGRMEGRAEGRMEGRMEGRAEGRMEGLLEFARAMLADGEPIEKIVRYTRLPREEIERSCRMDGPASPHGDE